jgi:hypothetical protein
MEEVFGWQTENNKRTKTTIIFYPGSVGRVQVIALRLISDFFRLG